MNRKGFTIVEIILKYSKNTIWSSSEVISDYSGDDIDVFGKSLNVPNGCYREQNAFGNIRTGKKIQLLDNIVDRSLIIKSKYPVEMKKGQYCSDASTGEYEIRNVPMYMGFLTETDLNNTKEGNKSWINDKMIWKSMPFFYCAKKKPYYSDYTEDTKPDYNVPYTANEYYQGSNFSNFNPGGSTVITDKSVGYLAIYEITGQEYYPVITIDSKATLEKNVNCNNPGTKGCPYVIKKIQ